MCIRDSHHTSQERQPAEVPELPNDQPRQLPRQSHVEDYTEQTEAASAEDHCSRTASFTDAKQTEAEKIGILLETQTFPACNIAAK